MKELLTTSNQLRFTTPALDPDKLAALLAAIRREVGEEPDMDRPSRDLEQFFLDVVHDAHQTDGRASGASHAGELASFLRSSE